MAGYQTAYDAYQTGQAAALANLLRGLQAQQEQANAAGQNLAGNALTANSTDPTSPASGMNTPGAPAGAGAPPNLTPAPNPPPVTQVPMPGAAPMQGGMPGGAPSGGGPMPPIPQINASQLQPPGQGGGAPPMAPMPQPAPPQGAPAGQGPAPAPQAGQMGQPQQNPWWKTMAAQIKQQNPNASGRDVMAALNAMQPVMNATNRQQLSDLHMQLAMQKLQSGQATPEEIDFLADEVQNGNQSILTRMPAPVRLAVMEKLETGGTSGSDAAKAATTYHGQQSAAAATGRRGAQIDIAISEFQKNFPGVDKIAQEVLPKDANAASAYLQNKAKSFTNDPKYAELKSRSYTLINSVARSVNATQGAVKEAEAAIGGDFKDYAAWKAAMQGALKNLTQDQGAVDDAMKRATQVGGKSSAMPADDGGGIQLDTPPPPDGFVVQ